jgi:electron transfer flavoprotein beta subunit
MNDLTVLVCLKQIPDPEAPSSVFRIDHDAKNVVPAGVPPVINPYDENALEAALGLKDQYGAHIIGISLGEKLAQPVLRKALAAGADELILVEGPQFGELDSYSNALVLSKAIQKIEKFDLIITGRHAADWDVGATGLLIAELLDIPAINLAAKIEMENNHVLVEKLSQEGFDVVRAAIPVLITVGGEIGELRHVNIPQLKAARKKPLKKLGEEDLGLEPNDLTKREIVELYSPDIERDCVFVEGGSPQEKGENLAVRLVEGGVIR